MMGSSSLLAAVAKRLERKVALITGGAGCLGSATAKLFEKHGAKVLIADIQDDSKVDVSPKNASSSSSSSYFIHCDVTNEYHIQDAVEKAVSMHGKLDIMLNNAGIMGPAVLDILSYEQCDLEHVLRVNVVGPFLGTKHAARVMKPARGGTIINVASVCSVMGGVGTHAYTVSKHAVLGLTRNAAVELGHYGIRVNCVSPYAFASSMSRRFLGRRQDDPLDDIYSSLDGLNLKAEDVAQALVYLASDESRYLSGHNLIVDGGFSVLNSSFSMFAK